MAQEHTRTIKTGSYEYNFREADKGQYSDAIDIMNKDDNVVNVAPMADYLVNCNMQEKMLRLTLREI